MSLSVSKTVNLSPGVLSFLTPESSEDESFKEYPTLGGILSNTDYAWLANGPNLEIIKTSNGRKIGAWSFNLVNNAEIICIEEIQKINKRPPLLAVCLDCGNNGSMICIFDFITSKVIRAIEVQETITSLHVIDSGNDIFTLPSPLRTFDGILTIGTAGGPVYLIDICREVCDDGLTLDGVVDIRDELNSCKLSIITLKDIDKIELHKESAVQHNDHLAIYLNATFDNKTQHFLLKGPEGGHRTYVDAKEAAVSALFYCSQLGSLLVGYNFGAFQVFNLVDLTLIYTSPVCEEHIPITHFTIQEPADDPRAYCYIWAVYSAGRDFQACFPLAVMYTFCYQTKEYHEGYGYLYQDFNYASIQFQMELTSYNGMNRRGKPQGGRCLRLNTIQRGNVLRDTTPHNDIVDDNLSLSIFIWNVIYNKRDSDVCVCIFDLNQWYKEQLPSIPDPNFSSTYMIQFCISDLFDSASLVNQDCSTLDVNIIEKSLKQFKGAQKLEEYFCPNSLSYELCALRENSVIFLQSKGVQKSLLAHIESSGPLCLIDPAETYQQIIGLGLLPLFVDLPSNIPISTNQRREIILSTALEHYLRGWLCKCASEWASGNFLSAGCSLDFLISWAFQRASELKKNCDKFCVPLFDYSQRKLDSNTTNLLNSCTRQLRNLANFYIFVIEKLFKFLSNPQLIQEQYKTLESIVVYFEVLLWLLNIGILPEGPISSYPRIDDFQRINVPYSAELLIDSYNQRRGFLKIENENLYSSSNSSLFIDNLIDSEYGGEILQGHWRDDGGNGLYPPPSIQALLRTYLIEDADIMFKHTIVSYFLLDLVMVLEQDRYKHIASYLIKFPTVFKLSLSKIKIIQGFWQLDHGDCNNAMGLLFDPLVERADLNEWHHKIALRLLILQNQHKLALLYLQVKSPIIKDDEDICAIISLYVANDMLDEAFYFEQRYNDKKFFIHLLEQADKNDKLKLILHRNLTQEQETLFLDYLTKNPKPYAKDLQIYYYIINSRYIEAFNLYNNSITNQIDCQGLTGQLNAHPRDQIIHHLKRLFPEITQKIFNFCYQHKDNIIQNVTRPTPVSAFVYNSKENIKYKSNFIGAVIAKTRETFSESLLDKKFITETTPFVRTSIISKRDRRNSLTVIDPKIIKVDNVIDSIGESAPPNKRLKLSTPTPSFTKTLSVSRLETPIVQRKIFKTPESAGKADLPQSILKKLSSNESSTNHEGYNLEDFKTSNSTPLSSLRKRKSLGSRKSLERPSPSVRFEDVKNLSPIDGSQSLSKELDNTETTREFSKSLTNQKLNSPEVSFNDHEIEVNSSKCEGTENIDDNNEEKIESPVFFSPKSRKSTPLRARSSSSSKRSLDFNSSFDLSFNSSSDSTKITFSESSLKSVNSPNLSIQDNEDIQDSLKDSSKIVSSKYSLELQNTSNISVDNEGKGDSIKDSPKILPNLRPRKSLRRKVLEHNIASRVLSSPRQRLSKRIEKEECNESKEIIQETQLESSRKFNDGKEIQRSNLIEKYSISTKTMVEETDEDDISIHDFDISGISVGLSDSFKRSLNDTLKTASEEVSQKSNEPNCTIENVSEVNENVSVSEDKTENVVEDKAIISETENQHQSKLSEIISNDNEAAQLNKNQVSVAGKDSEPTSKTMEEIAETSKTYLDDNETLHEETDDSIVIKDINNTTFGYSDSLRKILNDSSKVSLDDSETLNEETDNSIVIKDINDVVFDDSDSLKELLNESLRQSPRKELQESKNQNYTIEDISKVNENASSENRIGQFPSNVAKDNNESNTKSEIITIDDTQKESKLYSHGDYIDDDNMMEVDDYNINDTVSQTDNNKANSDNVNDDDDVKLIYDDLSQTSQTNQIDGNESENNDDNDIQTDETPNAFERNVLNDDLSEGSDSNDTSPEEPEVIEILSSSEEEKNVDEDEFEEDSSESSSSDDDADEGNANLGVIFEKNINDTSSESSENSVKSVISSDNEEENDEIKKEEEEKETETYSRNEEIEKKRQSYGLFHGPIVERNETIICVEEKTTKESIINVDETEMLEKLEETEVEEKQSTINETRIIEEIERSKKIEQSHHSYIESNETTLTDDKIEKSSVEESLQLENSKTEAKESHISESRLDEETLEVEENKEIDHKKRQSYGLFHGPISDTTIHEEDITEKDTSTEFDVAQLQDDSVKENPIVDKTVNEQDATKERSLTELDVAQLDDTAVNESENLLSENMEKEEEKTVEIEEKEKISTNKEIEENQESDFIRRQSCGLFHGIITETSNCEESENNIFNIIEVDDKSIDPNKSQLTDTQIEEETSQENYKKRQSYGLFHGSINETITEDRDCLTKLDISAIESIENKAIDEIKNEMMSEIGCQQLKEHPSDAQPINLIDLPSTSQIQSENSEIIDTPSTSGIKQEKSVTTQQRRRRRATSEDIEQSRFKRSTRTRSSSFHSEGHQDSYNSDLDNTSILSKSLRTRTITIDEENNKSIQRRRKTSVGDNKNNEPLKKTKKSKKHASILQLPEIIEEDDEDNHTKHLKETLENYSMSRRITRRQALLLQSIDPVVVLNKLPLDESLKQIDEGEHEPSPSDNTNSQLKPKRRLRSDSQNSNTSIQSDTKVSSTTGAKMRLRSSSSDAVEKPVTTSKRTKKTKSEAGDDLPEIEARTRTRSRTNSESSTASSASNTSKATRKKVQISKLPEIMEEDNKETPTPAKRVTRKRSHQK